MAKSLKDQNNWKLWLIMAANALFFYTVLEANAVRIIGLSALLSSAERLIPIGITGVVATVLNALPSPDLKATLVFWRLKHALPGHRAFSVYTQKDTRIDAPRLLKAFKGAFPSDPAEQNAAWYKLYKMLRDDLTVHDAHKTFLLLRDYTALSAFILIAFGTWAAVAITDKLGAAVYVGLLVGQFLLARQGAYNAGVRLVTNVLALKSAAAR